VLVQARAPSGLFAVQLCKALGAARVILTGTRDSRLTIASGWARTSRSTSARKTRRARARDHGGAAPIACRVRRWATSMQEALENVKRGGRIGVVALVAAGRGRHEPGRALQRAHLLPALSASERRSARLGAMMRGQEGTLERTPGFMSTRPGRCTRRPRRMRPPRFTFSAPPASRWPPAHSSTQSAPRPPVISRTRREVFLRTLM